MGIIEEFKLNRVAYLLEIIEKKDFDSKLKAFRKLEKIRITKDIGLFLIENSVREYGINDNNGGVNSSILSLCFKNYYDEYSNAINKVYKNLKPSVQNKVVFLLTTIDNESALNLYSDLVLKYYKKSDFIPISNLFERPDLYKYLFPKLYKALKFNNTRNNILILVNDYLNAGVVPVRDINKNKKIISDALCRVFSEALKYTYKNTYEYLNDIEYKNLRFFLEICINIESYVSTEDTKEVLDKLLKKNDNQLKLFIVDNNYRKNEEVKKTIINQIARDNASRYPLYEYLLLLNKDSLIPKKYLTMNELALSDFYINFGIYCNYKYEPKNMVLVDKREINGYDYYIFKFDITYKYDATSSEFLTNYIYNIIGMEKLNGQEITDTFIGISGGYDPKKEVGLIAYNHNKLLLSKINDNDSIDSIIDNLIPKPIDKAPEEKVKEIKKSEKIEKIKKKKSSKKEHKEKIVLDNENKDTKIKKKINIFSYLLLFLFLLFIVELIYCMMFINNIGGMSDNLNKNILKSVKIDKNYEYLLINGNEIFEKPENEYYVLLYKKSNKSKYHNYVNEYLKRNIKFYFVDINDDNNKFLFENNNLGFTITGDRLLKVKDREYEYYVNGMENILNEMKNEIELFIENENNNPKK